MPWYTVSALIGHKSRSGDVLSAEIIEHLLLVRAENEKAAFDFGSASAQRIANANDDLLIDGKAGYSVLLGMRNATEIPAFNDDAHITNGHGCEIGYNMYTLRDAKDYQRILIGEDVDLTLEGP